jgi:transcriptional regulator with XRE-family HTH domain
MSVRLDASRLRHERDRRAWTNTELAAAAGVSNPTVTAALAGRPVAPRTLRLIARALAACPVVADVDALLPTPDGVVS